ncbi:MAG: phenylalanine--tRNA ligase subunit alpha, partial [Candidatus Binatia bacterium]
MQESLEAFREEMTDRIKRSVTEQDIEQLRVEYLGRKGKLTLKLRSLKDVPAEERPQLGVQLNRLRGQIEEELDTWLRDFKVRKNERILRDERT